MNEQTLVQDFIHNFTIEHTPPDKAHQTLNHIRNFYEQLTDPQITGFCLFKVAQYIMRLKAVKEDTRWLIEQCIKDIISKSLATEFIVGAEALKTIFDSSCQYYKHNNLDPSLKYPLGHNRKLNWYEPQVGESIDVVRPYITSTSYCGWTRGVLVQKQPKKYTVKYENSQYTTTTRDLPLFDKVGVRTKDYDWRINLDVGTLIDAYNRIWYSSTVVDAGVENGSKRVRVSYRLFNQNGQKQDSLGQKYDGLGPNQDEWIDVTSSRIQRPGIMARQLCYYSHNAQQILIDDTYDLIFEKEYEEEPFCGLMRMTYTRSTSYLHFFEHLVKNRGYQIFMDMFKKPDVPIDTVITMMIIFGHTSFMVPKMGLNKYLPQCLDLGIQYIKEHFKHFNGFRLDHFSHYVNNIANRLYSLSRKHQILNNLRKFLSIEYLKLNLEKNLVSIKFLLQLIRPLRPYQSEQERLQLQKFFIQNNIFYKLIQNNVHQQMLSRSVDIIKYLMDSKLIGWNQIEHIWNVVPHSDLRGRTTIQKLIADVSKNLPIEFVERLIDIILNLRETELTADKLNLLRTLKNYQISIEYKQKILYYLWECLTVKSTNIPQKVEEQIESVYRGFISTIKQDSLKLSVVNAMVKRIKAINNIRNQMYLFRQFILTYPVKLDPNIIIQEGDNTPHTIKEVVAYLKNQNIYQEVIRLLAAVKNRQKTQSLLQFLDFFFSHDSSDISQIVKLTYQILGPSEVFLIWAKNLTYRAINFFIDMYENPQNMQKFQKVTTLGIDSIKTILLDINFYRGNIKILKKRKVNVQVQGPSDSAGKGPVTTGTSTSTQGAGQYSMMPDKSETLTFIYVLKSPFECIGLPFLLQLLQYISSSSVYSDVIKLIIQFIVNLDDKILNQAQLFMSQFLERVMKSIEAISKANIYNDSVKLQLQTYLNLIQQMFSQTEKNGLGGMVPHFSTIQGEILRLKFQNNITNCQLHKKEPLILDFNENQTFWKLKLRLAEHYQLPASKIDVIKYVQPIDDANLGKSLSDLFFFNEESIKVQKKEAKDIPKFELLNADNESLTERFQIIVDNWFNQYKNDQHIMTIEDLLKLGQQNWKGSFMKQKEKLQSIIVKHDKDKKNGLNLSQFKDYFIKASYQQNSMVWRLINLSGYKNNLRHTSDPDELLSQSAFPRKILSHSYVFKIIFSILSNATFQPLHLSFYRLLGLLQTDHQLFNQIKVNIKDFFQNQKCSYKLSYGIQTLLIQLQQNNQLFGDFYQHNGDIEIVKKLEQYFSTDESVYKFQEFSRKVVIPNLLKILSLFVYPLISENKYIRFLKKIKINLLDTSDIAKKSEGQQFFSQNQQTDKRAILLSKANHLDFDSLYKLCYKIFNNLIVHYDKDFLVRITNEIAKIYGYLAVIYTQFRPQDLFRGSNSDSLNIRRSCHGLIYIYFLQHPNQKFTLLQQLINKAPLQMKPVSNTYFDLIAILLEKTLQKQAQNVECQPFFKKLALFLVESFFKSPNQHRGHILPNKLINGILSCLLVILQKMPKIGQQISYFKEQLVRKALFSYDIKQKLDQLTIESQQLTSNNQLMHFDEYVKCKTEQNRKILMEVIFLLYKYSKEDHSKFFDRFIIPIFNQLVDTSRKNSNRCMYVGLTNFGATCYMNSMLQVLNSIDIFRNSILMASVQIPFVNQIKSLFSYLFFSQRVDYTPKNLLTSFVPPINPAIQQDTTEFLNYLFDQVEVSLKTTPYKRILPQLFQGNQVAQMICHNCGAKRQRVQQFFTYGVQVEGKFDLHSALQGMHAGELINDCLCETCNTRSDTTKRTILNQVPNFFFIHLKRMVFNYDMFMLTKIHTRLFFPEELNFEPYTKEGIELRQKLGVQYLKSLNQNQEERKKFEELTLHGQSKEYYQLKLKGIIVHSGTPDVGHYYAIINRNGSWVKFDDSRVTTFPQMNFQEECYGGNWIADEWGGPGSSKNAYVLIYEKVFKKDIELLNQIGENNIEKKIVPYQQFSKTYNTAEWYKNVWLDNHSLMLQQQLISQSYTKDYLSFICKMLDLISSETTIELISEILFKISALSGEVGTLPDIFEKNLHLIKVDMFKKYILSDSKRAFNILFHQQPKVRDFAAFYTERILVHAYLNGTEEDKNEVMKYIQEQLGILHQDAAKNWLRIDGYFKMFDRLACTAIKEPACYPIYQFLVNADIVAYFIDFILEKASPLNFIQKKYSLGTKSNPVNFGAGVNLVFNFVRNSYNLTGKNYQAPQVNPQYLLHLSDNAIYCLNCPAFYQKMIKQNQNPDVLALIIERLCIENLPFSESIARVLLRVINQNVEASDQMDTVLLCCNRYLRITDRFWVKRAECLLGTPSPFIYQQNILASIDEQKYVFPSNLQNIFPLQSLLNYAHINRMRCPLTVLNILKHILQGTSMSSVSMEFILKMPSPSYYYLRYIDWVHPYVNSVINHLNLTERKKQQVVSKISLCNMYLDDLQKMKKQMKQMKTLVLGEINKKQLVETINSNEEDVYINVYNIPLHVAPSVPNGNGNDTFDKYLTNGRLQKQATQTSNILKFFKQCNKPLAIKGKPQQQPQEKELQGLFDQNPYPDTQKDPQPSQKPVEEPKKEAPMEVENPSKVEEVPQEVKMEEEVVKEEMNVDGVTFTRQYLRCLEFVNKSDTGKIIILEAKNNQNSNNTLPSVLKFTVSKSTEEFHYTKIDPSLPWGDYERHIYVFDNIQNPKPFIRLYPNPFAQNQMAPEAAKNSQSLLEKDVGMQVQQKKEETPVAENADIEAFGDSNDGLINCPVCTMFNPVTEPTCQACGSNLH